MTAITASPLLKFALRIDALSGSALGPALFFGGPLLSPWLGIPATYLQAAGLALVPIAVFIAAQVLSPKTSTTAVWSIVGINVFWTVDSFFVLTTGLIQPTGLGYAFVIAQALVVGALAFLQVQGLQRSTARA